MTGRPQTLLRAARALGLRLEADGDDLYLDGDIIPPAALVAQLRRHKADLLEIVRCGEAEAADTIPFEWAAGFARLDPDAPVADFPSRRWAELVDDIGAFLDGGFAAQAAALGWGALDLFGCDDVRPYARIDLAGLLILLNGGRLVALTTAAAVIETGTGARHTFRRRPQPGAVLIWELVR